jgi:general secretion pathway protein G
MKIKIEGGERMVEKLKRGFTLIEMMVVMAIIAVLASVLLPNIAGMINRAKLAAAEGTVRNTYTALLNYMNDTGDYPRLWLYNSTYQLRNYLRDYATWSKWADFLKDPWSRWMTYYYPSCYGYVGSIYSNGPDGGNNSWSCWWWRYYGFAGDDIGKSIKKI